MTSKKKEKLIILGNDSNPHKQASKNPYTPRQASIKDAPAPRYHSPNVIQTAKGPIRKRATTAPAGMGDFSNSMGATSAAQSVAQAPLYYDYRFSTPDKYYFPRNRVVANAIWREIYKRDAAIAIATDMYAELPWSDFDIVGIDDLEIKKKYEDMFSAINIISHLTSFAKDFLITGELVIHALLNSSKGIWERLIPHNPDYIRAVGIGLAADQPLLWLRPTPEIRRMLASPDPRVRKLQKLLPKEVINAFRQNREVPLDSLNTTFMARKNSSSEIRGTSMYTRLYRTVMYEDFVVNASLAVSQRMAAPLRIFKLGDPATGWLPTEEDEASFAEMLSMAESDPMAAIITHNHVSVDLVGVADRALLISREWDFIERIKLLALGVAKSFLVGETSFACFEKGTEVIQADGTPKYIELIEPGDLVLDQFGKPQKVTNCWCEGVPNDLLEITAWGGRKFRVTPNHRFPAWMWPTECLCECGEKIKHAGRVFSKQKHAANYGCKYNYKSVECPAAVHHGNYRITTLPEGYTPDRTVEAQELRKGDFLKIPRTHTDMAYKDEVLNRDTARLLGYYLAEGSIKYGNTKGRKTQPCAISLTFNINEKKTWVKNIQEICKRLKIPSKIEKTKRKNICTIVITPKDKDFVRWFIIHGGEKSAYKRLSKEAMNWPDKVLLEVLKGYIRGDGCRSDNPTPSQKDNNCNTLAKDQFGTTSWRLATQMILILTRFGYPVGHGLAYPKPSKYKRKVYHIMRVQGQAAIDLCNFVWSEKLEAKVHRSSVWYDQEFMYVPIKEVKVVSNTNPVYNLEVENTHTYLICDGLATHNSAVAGLQTLLERLSSMRRKFEDDWIIRKLCEPVAEMNDFYKRPQNELDHRIRVKTKEDMEMVLPKLKWQKSLDPKEDSSILGGVYRDLKERGLLSDRTYTSAAGVDLDVERKNQEEERTYVKEHPELFPQPPDMEGGGKGAPGGAPGGAPKGPKPTDKGPGGALPPPAPLPGHESNKKVAKKENSLYNGIEGDLHDLMDKEGKVPVEDVLELLDDEKRTQKETRKFDELAQKLEVSAPTKKNFLSGE